MDRDNLIKLYKDYIIKNNLSNREIKEKYNWDNWKILKTLGSGYLNNVLTRLSNEIPEYLEYVEYKECEICGRLFTPIKSSVKFCSRECSGKQYVQQQVEYRVKNKKKKVRKPTKLSKVAEEARKQSKSYGMYVAEKRL